MPQEDVSKRLSELYSKIKDVLAKYETHDEKDIRRKHLEIMASEVLSVMYSIKILIDMEQKLPAELAEIFDGDEDQMRNYAYWQCHNAYSNLFSTFIFQTELVYRVFQSLLTGGNATPGGERNLRKVFSNLFNDVEQQETKDETKLQILLWKVRNTIHTGGIYFEKEDGLVLTYKENELAFTYTKAPSFLKDGFLFDLMSDLVSALDSLIESDKIKDLGFIEHPSYLALEK